MLRMGIAGFRHNHIFSLYEAAKANSGIEVVAGWEDDTEARDNAQQNYGVCFTHNSYAEMLEDSNIDVIAIGNYYGARGQMIISALKAGKHVIADKPLCTSLSELEEIQRLVNDTGLCVGLMLDMRDNPNALATKKIIEEGLIGEIHNIQFGGQHPLNYGVRPYWYFEEGKHGGVINDIAIHGIDLILYLTGLTVDNVVGARCWNAYATKEPAFKDCGQFMLELSNGAGVIADVSYAVPNSIGFSLPYYWEFRIWGSKGMLSFSADSDGVKLYQDGFTQCQEFAGIKAEDNYLDGFLNEIMKKETRYGTESALKSTKITLLVQGKANIDIK